MSTSGGYAPYLISGPDGLLAQPAAKGPWGPLVVGHVLAGLIADSAERAVDDEEFAPARLTTDLCRPVFMDKPIRADAEILRSGKRIRLVEVSLVQDDEPAVRGRALFLRRGVEPEQEIWHGEFTLPAAPNHLPQLPEGAPFFMDAHGWGSWDSQGRPADNKAPMPRHCWMREIRALIDDRPMSPFVRAAMAADVTNPMSNWGSAGLQFINADVTLSLGREPVGVDVGIATRSQFSADGVATASATVFDLDGPIGNVVVSSIASDAFKH